MSLLRPALAAGGPVAPVSVSGGNLTWVVIVAVIALAALAVAGVLVREVLAASQGTAKMQEIAKAVQEGAAAYLRRQFRTLGVFVFIIFWILLVLPADTGGVRWGRSAFFLVGSDASIRFMLPKRVLSDRSQEQELRTFLRTAVARRSA